MPTVLKSVILGTAGKELGRLRKAGTELSTAQDIPLFVFMGDTVADVFSKRQELLMYPFVMTECTFLHEKHVHHAKKKKHTGTFILAVTGKTNPSFNCSVAWPELKPHIERHPSTTFLLIHFSHQYKQEEVTAFFQEQGLPNVVPWLDDPTYCPNNHCGYSHS